MYRGISMFRCIDVSMYRCIVVSVYRCIGVSVYRCIGVLVYRFVGVLVYRFINVAMYRRIGVCVYRCVGVLVYQCIINVVSMHYRCIIGISVYRCCLAYWCIAVAVKSKKLCYKQNKINRKYSKICSKIVPNSWKNGVWYHLGALWAPSWRQDTAKTTPGADFHEKRRIFRCPVGSKMEQKSEKNLYKNRYDFLADVRTTFSHFFVDFGTKKLSKMRVLG